MWGETRVACLTYRDTIFVISVTEATFAISFRNETEKKKKHSWVASISSPLLAPASIVFVIFFLFSLVRLVRMPHSISVLLGFGAKKRTQEKRASLTHATYTPVSLGRVSDRWLDHSPTAAQQRRHLFMLGRNYLSANNVHKVLHLTIATV